MNAKQIQKVVRDLGYSDDPYAPRRPEAEAFEDIYSTLVEGGVAPCVAREWANEPSRGRAIRKMAQERKDKVRFTGAPREFGRHIIKTEDALGREVQFHATKGARSYRGSTA